MHASLGILTSCTDDHARILLPKRPILSHENAKYESSNDNLRFLSGLDLNGQQPFGRLQARDALQELGDKGAFVRKDSVFRDWVEEGGTFPPEGGL